MASASLDAVLTRLRLHGAGAHPVVLVHGHAAADAWWLSRLIAAKVSHDSDYLLLVSSRTPSLPFAGTHPGVAYLRLSGPPICIPVEPSADAACAAACSATARPSDTPSPLRTVCELLETGLLARAGERHASSTLGSSAGGAPAVEFKPAGDSPAASPADGPLSTVPEHSVGVVVEDLASLLLAHPLSDVLECLLDISRGLRGVRAAPLIVVLDHAVVGASAFTALSAISGVVIRVDDGPRPSGSAAGYLHGSITVTEVLSTGKTRSFVQQYGVHGNGSVALGSTFPAPAAAALSPYPTVSTVTATSAPATSSSGSKAPAGASSGQVSSGSAGASSRPAGGTVSERPSTASSALASSSSSAGLSGIGSIRHGTASSGVSGHTAVGGTGGARSGGSGGGTSGGSGTIMYYEGGRAGGGGSAAGPGGGGGYDDGIGDGDDDDGGMGDLPDDLDDDLDL